MSLVEMLGLTAAVLMMGYLARNMLELGSGVKRLPPGQPRDLQPLRDPMTMSWDEPDGKDF